MQVKGCGGVDGPFKCDRLFIIWLEGLPPRKVNGVRTFTRSSRKRGNIWRVRLRRRRSQTASRSSVNKRSPMLMQPKPLYEVDQIAEPLLAPGIVQLVTTRRRYNKDKAVETTLLRRSYREGGKVRRETLANLSHLPRETIDLVRASLRSRKADED
jgi:hypothetical protein